VASQVFTLFQFIERSLLFLDSKRPVDVPDKVFQKVLAAKAKLLKISCIILDVSVLQGITSIIDGIDKIGLKPYPQLGGVFGDILSTPLHTLCTQGQNVMMFHRHDDYAKPQPLLKEPQLCTCSISQLILRYCMTIEQYTKEGELTKHLQVLIRNERFRVKFAEDFHNHLGFVFKLQPNLHRPKYTFSGLIQMQYMLANSKLTATRIIASPLFIEGMKALEYFNNMINDCQGEYHRDRYLITEKIQYILIELVHTPLMVEYFLETPELKQILTSIIMRPQQKRMCFIPGIDFSNDNESLNQLIIHSRVDSHLKVNSLWRMFMIYKNLKHIPVVKRMNMLSSLQEDLSTRILASNEYSSRDDSPISCSFFDLSELILLQTIFLSCCVDHSG
jgi:hypothetical protein